MLAAIMHRTLEELRQGIDVGLAGLDARQMQHRLDPGSWSAQQILEHLLLTYALSAETFETRVAKGAPTQAKLAPVDRLGQFVVCTLGLFPKGRKSPAAVEPPVAPEPMGGDALAIRARKALERFDSAANEAEQLFGRRPAITHPVLGPMSVEHWRRFHLVHGKHHLRQIQTLRASHGEGSGSAGE